MTDYYPLIARAVAGLDKNTGEARRALYERARTALVAQLRGVEPALGEGVITKERLALEDAIRKVEGEAARRPRQETPEPRPAERAPPPPSAPLSPAVKVADTPSPPEWEELQRELDGLAPPPPASDAAPEQAAWPEPAVSEPRPDETPLPLETESQPGTASAYEAPLPPEPPVVRPRKNFSDNRPSLTDQGMKGFRDVVSETDDLGGASASASKSARKTRDAFSALPPAGDLERLEPRFSPGDLAPPAEPDFPPPPRSEPRISGRPLRPAQDDLDEETHRPRRPRRGIRPGLVVMVALLVVLGGGVYAYLQWGSNIAGMFRSTKAPVTQAAKEDPQARPKISDRVGGAQQTPSSRTAAGATAAVAQRAVLYERGGANAQERKQYVGSVIWRTETASPGPGKPPDVAIKAEVEIPERQMRMSVTIRRNLDPALPASHTIEVLFSTAADFQPGGIADLNGVVMEDAEQSRGLPLAGMRVKVTNGFFLVGLSAVEADVRRNIQLLKERPWMHIRMAYNDGQPALLAIEKGVPGERVIEDALTAWGQNPPSAQPR